MIKLYIGALVSAVALSGCFLFQPQQNSDSMPANQQMQQDRDAELERTNTMQDSEDGMTDSERLLEAEQKYDEQSDADVMPQQENDSAAMKYQGQVIAGTAAPLLEFNQADYDAAIASGKLVVLYFYANWCPTCRIEFPKMEQAFDLLTSTDVVGFRINFNDNETTSEEEAMARKYGIAYQHTKVLVRGDQRIIKTLDSWSIEQYLENINSNL